VSARFLFVLPAVITLAACGGNSPAGPGRTTGSTGLQGKVTVSPATNTCKAGASCAKPAIGYTLEFSQYGHVVVTAKTGKDGSYRVGLPSKGRYVISVRGHQGVAPTVKPPTATVQTGQVKQLDIQLDVGIR
jgi:hypothetical protein